MATDCDGDRPLTFELDNQGSGIIRGERKGFARLIEHYVDLILVKDGIRGLGECCWSTDGMGDFAVAARRARVNNWAYISPWSWVNYWPNFLEGMSHARHAWRINNHADRMDHVDGWGSTIVRFVQQSLSPYLVTDVGLDEMNTFSTTWPDVKPTYKPGDQVSRSIVAFNGGLTSEVLVIIADVFVDSIDGQLVHRQQHTELMPPGSATTFKLEFQTPVLNGTKYFCVSLRSTLKGRVLFEDSTIRLRVTDAIQSEAKADLLGEDSATNGDWMSRYGRGGYLHFGAGRRIGDHIHFGFDEAKEVAATEVPHEARALWEFANEADRSSRRILGRLVPATTDTECLRFHIDVGHNAMKLTLYFCDLDLDSAYQLSVSAEPRMKQSDSSSPAVVDRLNEGIYLSFSIRGNVTVTVTPLNVSADVGSQKPFVNAIFLDPVEA